ncbi:MAG: AlpA family phage regulatory protein [Methylococcales bacterium]
MTTKSNVTPITKPSTALKVTQPDYRQIPETGFLRLPQIVGDKKNNIPAIIPIGKSTFLKRVKDGVFPAPIRLGVRTVAWRVEDIRALVDIFGGV